MTTLNRAFKDDVIAFQNNPTRVQDLAIQLIRDSSDGLYDIVDCTNPLVALLEVSANTVSAALEKMEALNRKQYSIAAQSIEDLYPHMSDKDFADRFATPSTAKFSLVFVFEELEQLMVFDPSTNSHKLVIPPHTYFTIADTVFSMQYPVVISKLAHGGYSVLYDVANVSPLQTLDTNFIAWETRHDGSGRPCMYFQVDVQQFSIISEQESFNEAQELKMTVSFTEQYYFARVYHGSAETGWTEIRTTHTDQIYDVTVPTAVLQVLDRSLYVRVPQIYVNTGLLSQKIRVDLYQTRGPLQLNMTDYPIDAFVTTFLTLDKREETAFSAPLKSLREYRAFSPTISAGGTNAMSFMQLRERVINGTMGLQDRVITNIELPAALESKGYEIVANVDNITNRDFLATRSMPTPVNPKLITPAAASIETVSITAERLRSYSAVLDNGKSLTITPKMLYQNVGGVVQPVSDAALAAVQNLSNDQRAQAVTNGNYYFTPFHYVMDMSGNNFDLRAYYLDSPQIDAKIFVAENPTTLMQVSTQAYTIDRTDRGYRLSVITKSGDVFKELRNDEVHVQLAFTPAGEKDRAYVSGMLVNVTPEGERVYVFDLATNLNVDSEHNLQFTEFFMYTQDERISGTPLVTTFDILYSVSSVMGETYRPSTIDNNLGLFLLPTNAVGVAHEQLRIKFGDVLDKLWARSRTVAESGRFDTWDLDVLQTYQEDVYERGANGEKIQIIDGKVVIKKLHAKGDVVLDGEGKQVYKHRKGDIVLDEFHNPVLVSQATLSRQMDLLLIEGAYWFATDAVAASYRTELTDTIVSWLTNDLAQISKKLIEQSRIYFYPKISTGYIEVMLSDGTVTSIHAGQSLRIDLVVSKDVNSNDALKARISRSTIALINDAMRSKTVSISEIESALRDLYAGDVIDVSISGLGGASNYPMLTVVDDANRCSLSKRVVAQTDGTLMVEENATINYIVHTRRN